MVTFATSAPDVQRTGIGSQQIVQESTTSFAGIAQAAGSALVQGADLVGTELAKSKAKEIVSAANKGLDSDIASVEGTSLSDDPTVRSVSEVARKTANGVASGKISRENARLIVANSVTKAIEEQPFLTQKIRAAAGNLLGFNPESEGVRNFFASFDTDAELRAAASKTVKLTPAQKSIANLQSIGYTVETATEVVRQQTVNNIEKENLLNRASVGNLRGEDHFRDLNTMDGPESVTNIFGGMKSAFDAGEEVTASSWGRVISTARNASWSKIVQQLNSTPSGPDTATLTRMNALHGQKYDLLLDQVKDFDSTFLRNENLDRIVSLQKTFAGEAFPVYTFLNNAFGERVGASTMDLIRSAQGNTARLEALLSATPGLQPLVGLLRSNPKEFNMNLEKSVRTLADPTAEFTEEQAPFLDLFLSQAAVTAPPKEREKIVESLFDKNLNNKATSILASAGRASATEKEVRRMTQEWDTVKTVTPNVILQKIAEGNKTLTDRGARVELTPDGKHLILVKGKNPLTGEPFQATTHPAFSDVQKLNVFLRAGGKGWGQDLGIPNVEALAKQLQVTLNGTPTASSPAIQTARDTGSASGLPDGTYADAEGNRITVLNGQVVGG